jgi:hypothetical protein
MVISVLLSEIDWPWGYHSVAFYAICAVINTVVGEGEFSARKHSGHRRPGMADAKSFGIPKAVVIFFIYAAGAHDTSYWRLQPEWQFLKVYITSPATILANCSKSKHYVRQTHLTFYLISGLEVIDQTYYNK